MGLRLEFPSCRRRNCKFAISPCGKARNRNFVQWRVEFFFAEYTATVHAMAGWAICKSAVKSVLTWPAAQLCSEFDRDWDPAQMNFTSRVHPPACGIIENCLDFLRQFLLIFCFFPFVFKRHLLRLLVRGAIESDICFLFLDSWFVKSVLRHSRPGASSLANLHCTVNAASRQGLCNFAAWKKCLEHTTNSTTDSINENVRKIAHAFGYTFVWVFPDGSLPESTVASEFREILVKTDSGQIL